MQEALHSIPRGLNPQGLYGSERFGSRCPRCRGPLFRESDFHGEFSSCLYCGFVREAGTSGLASQENRRRRPPVHGGTAL